MSALEREMESFISNCASYMSSLPKHEVFPTKWKIILCAPAFLALGAQKLGSIPLQPAIAAFVVSDFALHYFVENSTNPDVHIKARKFEWLIDRSRLTVLVWSAGHLLHSLSNWTSLFPLSADSILKVYSTYYKRHKFEHYTTHLSDQWLLSWPVAAVATYALTKFKQLIMKDQLELEDRFKDTIVRFRELYPSSWTAALQLVVYISLAVFSKSHLTFAVFFALSSYTQHQRASHRAMSIKLNFVERDVNVLYEEIFRFKSYSEVADESHRLLAEQREFKSFNTLREQEGLYRLYVNKLPFSLDGGSDQLLHRKQSFQHVMNGAPVELDYLQDYQPGQDISVCLDSQKFKRHSDENQRLTVELQDGTWACFPNVLYKMIRGDGFEGRVIKARILSKSCDSGGQVELYCSSLNLPEWEKLNRECIATKCGSTLKIIHKSSISSKAGEGDCSSCRELKRIYRYDGPMAEKVSLCRACIQTNFENKTQEFKIFNLRDNRACAEGPAPEEMTVDVWAQASDRERPVSISWVNYHAGEVIVVPIREGYGNFLLHYKAFEKAAFVILKDGTVVNFLNVPPLRAAMFFPLCISARVISKHIDDGILHLECVSDALPRVIEAPSSRYEEEWGSARNGILRDLDAPAAQEEIGRLDKNGALYLFLRQIINKKPRRDILDVSGSIDMKEITAAYRKKTVFFHPDKNKESQTVAKILFQALNIAYGSLQKELGD